MYTSDIPKLEQYKILHFAIQVVGQDLEEATRKFRKFIEKISIKLNKCKLVYANFTNKYNQHLLPIKIDDAQYPTKTCTETLRTNS